MSSGQVSLWGQIDPVPPPEAARPSSASACELLELTRLFAIVMELHPDHWPASVRDLAKRIAKGQAWAIEAPKRDADWHESTSYLALALVGRDPEDRNLGRPSSTMTPRCRRKFEADVERLAPLRAAIIEAMETSS